MTSKDANDDTASYDLAEGLLPGAAPVAAGPIAAPAAVRDGVCAVCKRPIADAYYTLGTARVCPNCRATAGGDTGGGFVRFLKATALGVGGGLLGAVVWFGVRRASGYEIGYVAILVGFLVGIGVLKGSGRRGGRGYQFLALALTYLAIAVNYAPDVYAGLDKSAREDQTTRPAASADADVEPVVRRILVAVIAVPVTLAAPILAGIGSPISFLISGIALWEAWKINRVRSTFVGPFGTGVPPPMKR